MLVTAITLLSSVNTILFSNTRNYMWILLYGDTFPHFEHQFHVCKSHIYHLPRLAINLRSEIIHFSKKYSYFILNRTPLLMVLRFKPQEVSGVHMEQERGSENFPWTNSLPQKSVLTFSDHTAGCLHWSTRLTSSPSLQIPSFPQGQVQVSLAMH